MKIYWASDASMVSFTEKIKCEVELLEINVLNRDTLVIIFLNGYIDA